MPVQRRKKPPDLHAIALPDLDWSPIKMFPVLPSSLLCQLPHSDVVGSRTRRLLDFLRDVARVTVPRVDYPVTWPCYHRSEVWVVLSSFSGRFTCRISNPYGMGVVDAWSIAGSNEVWSSFPLYFWAAWVMGVVPSVDRRYGSFPLFWFCYLIWSFSVTCCTRSGSAGCFGCARVINCASLYEVCCCLSWLFLIAFVSPICLLT